jgi:hypothetical protein
MREWPLLSDLPIMSGDVDFIQVGDGEAFRTSFGIHQRGLPQCRPLLPPLVVPEGRTYLTRVQHQLMYSNISSVESSTPGSPTTCAMSLFSP